jgi:hypothetical protein
VVDEALGTGVAVEAAEDDRRVAAPPVAVLDEDPDPLVRGEVGP